MAEVLAAAGDEGAAEAVAGALAPALGRAAAHDLVAAAVRQAREQGSTLRAVLSADARCALSDPELAALTVPDTGAAGMLVDRALASRTSPRLPQEQP
jgi:3-carboxy-cis,cis-muconate cycloisomerase